jgi:hypothetical protein
MNGSEGAEGFKLLSVESMAAARVAGRPLAASEERHTLHVLGDGTRIENTQTDKFYRDDAGRSRLETQNGEVFILDPVQGITAEITAGGLKVHHNPGQIHDGAKDDAGKLKPKTESPSTGQAHDDEDLGYQSVNGVIAHGTRSTTVIPAGQIGNDRPIRIVNERWYSSDLQMNVRTIHSDPRFGETTYQLTNISQGTPDPALFKIPQDSQREHAQGRPHD